jgi:hypothetical protein
MPRRLPFALEDLGLAAWNAVGIPVLALSSAAPVLQLGDEPNAFAGWVQLLAVVGAIVAIATRPAGSGPSRDPIPTVGIVMAFMGPMIGGIAFVAGSASTYLGGDVDEPVVGIAFLAAVCAMVFADHLPVLDAGLRRLLLLPFILVSAGIFNGFAAELLGGLDPGLFSAASLSAEGGLILYLLIMVLGGVGAFYAALVAAPRILAEPDRFSFWPVGFIVYLVSALLGIGWLANAGLIP